MTDAERIAVLEAALRDVTETYRSRTEPPWCTRCGADWTGEAHGHGCPAGRAVRLLEGSGAAPAESILRAENQALRDRVFDYSYSYQDPRRDPAR